MDSYEAAPSTYGAGPGATPPLGARKADAGAVVLAPGHPVLPLGEDLVQMGLGTQALRLAGDRGRIESALLQLRRGRSMNGAEDLTSALLGRGLARRRDEPERKRARLQASSLLVEGLGTCGSQIVEHLCAQNVGALLLRDGRKVGPTDIGGIYRTVHHGLDRTEALREAMRRRPERTALIGCPPESRAAGADLHVLCTGPGAWEALRRAAEESQTVLPVELSIAGVRIGPLVSPGRLVCPQCLRLHALDRDPQWDVLQAGLRSAAEKRLTTAQHTLGRPAAKQLKGLNGLPSDPQLEPSPSVSRGAEEELLAVQAAAMVAYQINSLAGGRRAAVESAVITVDASTGGLSQHPVAAHPECACRTMVL